MNKIVRYCVCLFLCILLTFKQYDIYADINYNNSDIFFDNTVMAHAMGGYKNNIYNNHEKALKNTIKNGYKFIELDLILTNDKNPTLVCSHGWNESTCKYNGIEYIDNLENTMTFKQFKKLKIQGKYSTMTAKQWVKYLKKYDDIVWEIDFRTLSYERAKQTAEKLISLFNKNELYLLDKVLIQVGSEDMYKAFSETYNFKHYQYFIHKAELNKIDNILKFCVEHNFDSMAVKSSYMTKDRVDKIHNSNMKVLCYTVDDIKQAKKYINMGADCICTNFILPFEV